MSSRITASGRAPSTAPVCQVVLVDDHRLVAQGLAAALRPHVRRVHVALQRDVQEVVDRLRSDVQPPVVVLDVHLGGGLGGLALVGPLRRAGARVLVLAEWETDDELLAAVEAGAVGWVHKSARFDDLLEALNRAASGLPVLDAPALRARLASGQQARAETRARADALASLTPREADVLDLLAHGLAAQEIADTAVVSLATVRSQIRAILRKLGVRSQLAAVAIAHETGFRRGSRPLVQVRYGAPA